MSPKAARILLVLAAFLGGLGLCLGVVLILTGGLDRASITPAAAAIGGPFQLTDQNGQTVSDATVRGRPTLVFFGFTHCPDVCPTKLFEISEVLNKLGPDAGKVNALFITVDPERDTPAALKDYLASFNPRVTGLTGDPTAIAATAKAYRAYYKKVPLDKGGYTMDHTAIVYLMDKSGRFVAPFDLKRTAEAAATDLKRYF